MPLMATLQEYDFGISKWVYEQNSVSHMALHMLSHTGEGYTWLFLPVPLTWLCAKYGYGAWIDFIRTIWVLNLIDIVLIALSKQIFHRPRPNYQKTNSTAVFLGADRFSFPSGHASRSVSLAICMSLYPGLSLQTRVLWCVWAAAIALSRVLLGRHYMGDILGGCVLAGINVWILQNHSEAIARLLFGTASNGFLARWQ